MLISNNHIHEIKKSREQQELKQQTKSQEGTSKLLKGAKVELTKKAYLALIALMLVGSYPV